MTKNIGIDFDDVLAECHVSFIQYWNQRHGTAFKKEDFVHLRHEETWGRHHDEVVEIFKEFVVNPGPYRLFPRPGALAMVARLHYAHNLHIITNRHPSLREATVQWIEEHFGSAFCGVHFCDSTSGRYNKSKASVCKHIGATLLLDDHLINAKLCASESVDVYLFDQPWNRQKLPLLAGAIVRISCWEDKKLETLFE